MNYIECIIKFSKQINMDDAMFSAFCEKAKTIGFTNTLTNGNVRACFDSNNNQVSFDGRNFVYIMNLPTDEQLSNYGASVVSFVDGWLNQGDNFKVDIRLADSQDTSSDTFEESKEMLKTDIDNVKGIGYRYFIETPYGLCDFKVEPFIQNPISWYFESSIGCQSLTSLDMCGDFINYMLSLFKKNKSKVLL